MLSISLLANMTIKAVLIDLSGTLHVESDPTPNAIAALERLRKSNVHIKFVTNTTKESGETLFRRLVDIGFKLEKNEIFSSLSAAAFYIKDKKLNPFYLLSEDARRDFPDSENCDYDSVAVGLAPNAFNYEQMNKAFKIFHASDMLLGGVINLFSQKPFKVGLNLSSILLKTPTLIAIHQGKYYKRSDGLALGPGCFIKGLEYAASTTAIVIGKPNRYFFKSAIPVGIAPTECVMIGDDANDDVVGAMSIGMKGILVKTGKYLPNVVVDPPPTALLENFSEAVEWVEAQITRA